jgi:hypothetical protein
MSMMGERPPGLVDRCTGGSDRAGHLVELIADSVMIALSVSIVTMLDITANCWTYGPESFRVKAT